MACGVFLCLTAALQGTVSDLQLSKFILCHVCLKLVQLIHEIVLVFNLTCPHKEVPLLLHVGVLFLNSILDLLELINVQLTVELVNSTRTSTQ